MFIDHSVPVWVNVFVIFANILNLIYNVPQMITTYQRKTTSDISGWFLSIRLLASVIWIFYAAYIINSHLIIANVITIIATLFIGYYKVYELATIPHLNNTIQMQDIDSFRETDLE